MNKEPSSDPMPQPPREPLPEECCGGGCNPCVYDRYSDAVDRYRDALQAWHLRHPELVPEPTQITRECG